MPEGLPPHTRRPVDHKEPAYRYSLPTHSTHRYSLPAGRPIISPPTATAYLRYSLPTHSCSQPTYSPLLPAHRYRPLTVTAYCHLLQGVLNEKALVEGALEREAEPRPPSSSSPLPGGGGLHGLVVDGYRRNNVPVPSSMSSFMPKLQVSCPLIMVTAVPAPPSPHTWPGLLHTDDPSLSCRKAAPPQFQLGNQPALEPY